MGLKQTINQNQLNTLIVFIIPLFSVILFILFYIFLSSEIFGGMIGSFNDLSGTNKKGVFPWVNEIPLLFFCSVVLFLCLSLFFYKQFQFGQFKNGLKANFIIFCFLLLYSLFVLIKFYLIKIN